jgi:hypothetical protein
VCVLCVLCVRVCVCVCEREREREGERGSMWNLGVCVRERERGREREEACEICVCTCVCVWERGREREREEAYEIYLHRFFPMVDPNINAIIFGEKGEAIWTESTFTANPERESFVKLEQEYGVVFSTDQLQNYRLSRLNLISYAVEKLRTKVVIYFWSWFFASCCV